MSKIDDRSVGLAVTGAATLILGLAATGATTLISLLEGLNFVESRRFY